MRCKLIGIPLQDGAGRLGCEMGPSAYRTAGLGDALIELGHDVLDLGNIAPGPLQTFSHPNIALKKLPEIVAWIEAIEQIAYRESAEGIPLFLGGDHALSAGTVAGVARRAGEEGRKLFVLWLDAHTDFHNLQTTKSGNLHGTPVAYFTGQPGFEGFYPPIVAPVPPRQVCMFGIRSVDPDERRALTGNGAQVHDMRAIDEHGVAALMRTFLARVEAEDGILHVSLDVDFLEPSIAPAVGTTVPGGATFREAHLVMEMLSDSGRVRSLDLVELNPFLDERGKTAHLMVDLAASLFGRQVLDRPTSSFTG